MLSTLRNWWSPDPKASLRAALGDVKLPAFRATTLQVLRALRDPNADPGQIGRVIERDPMLSLRVLKAVNSASSGLRSRVDNIEHAARLLGKGDLEMVVLAVAVKDAMPKTRVAGFDQRQFWGMAARRAATARAFAQVIDPKHASVAFTGGLLQDLAVPLLAASKGKAYTPLLDAWVNDGANLEVMESAEYGWNHGEVAGWLCQDWNFPETLIDAIGGHHLELAPAPVQLVALLSDGTGAANSDEVIEKAKGSFGMSAEEVIRAVSIGRVDGEELAKVLAS